MEVATLLRRTNLRVSDANSSPLSFFDKRHIEASSELYRNDGVLA
jgi:hypothetical protein